MEPIVFEVVPHPRYRGDWILKPNNSVPWGLWYGNRDFAVSYAEWRAREKEHAEICIYNHDGTRAERRIMKHGKLKPAPNPALQPSECES
jgi:hypothetical protein